MTNETENKPSKDSVEKAEKLSDPYPDCTHPEHEGLAALVECRRKTNTLRIALALDQAKAEGAERVGKRIQAALKEESFTKDEENGHEYYVSWDKGFNACRDVVLRIVAARQALQEEKGE